MTRALVVTFAAVALATPGLARAHCDTLDGPVAGAARAALSGGDLNPVLAWASPAAEAELRAAFAKARAARKGGGAAREVADTWFLETVVRVHRAGEGAPYTGLKPAGGATDPAVAAVDAAVAANDPRGLEALLAAAVHDGLRARWERLAGERKPGSDVAAGRRWVAAYVPLVHWAEAVRGAASGAAHPEAGAAGETAERDEHRAPEAPPHGHAGH